MSYGPYRIVLVLPPGRLVLFVLLCSHLQSSFGSAIDARMSLSVLSLGGRDDALARVGFDDVPRPICFASWSAGDRVSRCELPDGKTVDLGGPERTFLDGQVQYLNVIRNASENFDSKLGITYSCSVSESGLEECRVTHVKDDEPFSTSVLRKGGPGLGLFLSALNREVAVRWFDMRRRLLELDARAEVRHRFRTTSDRRGNRTVCEVWLDSPLEAIVSVVGPQLRETVVGEVLYDSGSAYGRAVVETEEGEDVSLLSCEVATVTGLRARFHHPTRASDERTRL